MVCKNCGKEIPEESLYCEACGAPLEEPVVLNVSKEDIKRAGKEEKVRAKERIKATQKNTQPLQTKKISKKPEADLTKKVDIVGYAKSIGADHNTLLAFIGALMLYLSPFLNWIFERVFDTKRKANLFEIGMKSSMVEKDGSILAMGQTIVLVLAVVSIIIGIWMLLLSGADYIRSIRRFAGNVVMRVVPIVILLVIFFIIINNKTYTHSLQVLEDNVRLAKEMGTTSNYSAGRGIGPVIYICGLIVYTFGTLGDLLNHRNQEPDE